VADDKLFVSLDSPFSVTAVLAQDAIDIPPVFLTVLIPYSGTASNSWAVPGRW